MGVARSAPQGAHFHAAVRKLLFDSLFMTVPKRLISGQVVEHFGGKS